MTKKRSGHHKLAEALLATLDIPPERSIARALSIDTDAGTSSNVSALALWLKERGLSGYSRKALSQVPAAVGELLDSLASAPTEPFDKEDGHVP